MITYHLLVIMLQAAHNQIHRFLRQLLRYAVLLVGSLLSLLLCQVVYVVLVSRALQVEGVILVDYLEQSFVLCLDQARFNLLVEGLLWVVRQKLELVAPPEQNHLLLCLQSALRQVPTLVVEESVRVATPSYSFHQDSAIITQLMTISPQTSHLDSKSCLYLRVRAEVAMLASYLRNTCVCLLQSDSI